MLASKIYRWRNHDIAFVRTSLTGAYLNNIIQGISYQLIVDIIV